ncbi:histidine phosphatase family protein [Phenylobacterium aquaticum]|uniref:histidine phosphatase family protein n=1 Tax=Phenylobacterium aquaticum TaxID=1763816 RepID=UPI0026F049C7|nr:histidine phosphatase family protein [Phenylobacterium aquaticum]
MPRDLRIYLIRHGESEANLDKSVNALLPDHRVPLSVEGLRQAAEAGEILRSHLSETALTGQASRSDFAPPKIRMWRSPYLRTRQTSDAILRALGGLTSDGGLVLDVKEKSQLREQSFGLFDGVPDQDLPKLFPREHALYQKAEQHEGRFWAPMPMGESRCDVAERVHATFGTFHRDAERHDIHDLIVVSHGVTIRAFAYAWLGYEWEWFERQPNPGNCSIWMIEGNVDRGFIHKGWSATAGHNAQEKRESGEIST